MFQSQTAVLMVQRKKCLSRVLASSENRVPKNVQTKVFPRVPEFKPKSRRVLKLRSEKPVELGKRGNIVLWKNQFVLWPKGTIIFKNQ